MVLFALVVVMIAVGGLTRLTDSGLSITEWRPVTGALPPMSEAAWKAEFDKYRAIPEYQLQNKGMSLAEFKVIYWWEWGHRQLGRVIGLVWAVGFFCFPSGEEDTDRLDRAASDPRRTWRAAGRDRLVDGVVGSDGHDAGRGLLPAGDASGAGLRDPGRSRVVHHASGPDGGRSDAGAARARGAAVRACRPG